MLKKIKIFIASILLIVTIGGGMLVPQRAHTIPVIDIPLNALTGMNAATTIANWATQLTKWVKEELWKTLRDQVVKAIVNEINKQTVAWIQGNGKPKFVTDWQGFLKDAAMEGVNQTISQSQLADLCTPFQFQLRIAMIPETTPISQKAKCSISDIVANVEDFYDNFENGGWLAYGASIKPENNLYMQLVMFDDDMKTRSTLSSEKKKQEAGAGSGFLSVSTCTADDSQELYDYCVENNYFDTGDPNYCYDYADQNKKCTKENVQTPGDAVAGAVKNMIGSDNIYVSGVQSIISAAINAGINRMMSEGLSLMTGNENAAAGFNPATQFQTELDALYGDQRRDLIGQVQPYFDQWKELSDIKKRSQTYIAQISANLTAIQSIQATGVACPPQVTTQEITSRIPQNTRLTTEVAELQVKIDDGQRVITLVTNADFSKTRDSLLATDGVKDFIAKYNREGLVSTPGSTYPQKLQDAQDEEAALAAELNLVLTRLQTCRTVQGPVTPTTP